MGRQRTKIACIECNKAAAKYPDAFPVVCSLNCAELHITRMTKLHKDHYKICKLHLLFIPVDDKKCLQCEYEETDGGRQEPTGEIKIIENTPELMEKKAKNKDILDKWKANSPGVLMTEDIVKPVIDPATIEYSETMTQAEYAAWFNKDTQ